ncbi:MAG: cysteine hydrolase [Gammaproteobacteria bacterium]|nr:cysteine hydrolase [Gammaproteobacteria bacterium]
MTATPFSRTSWNLIKGHTAIVHIDPQNDFLHPDGWYATHDVDISHMRRVIEPIKALCAQARKKQIPMVWTRHGTKSLVDGGPFMELRSFLHEGGLRQNTWGYEVLAELEPDADEDWFVEKTRLSAFYNTNLETILRGLKAKTVILTGVLTNQCVGATTKDAIFRDFKPIVVEDATGTTMPHLHDPIIECIQNGWGQVNTLERTLAEIGGL